MKFHLPPSPSGYARKRAHRYGVGLSLQRWMDVVWSILVLLGIEKLRIVLGFTEANALDLS
jgi:hypothetical protein